MEILSASLRESACNGLNPTPFYTKGFHVSHLLFADDVMIFAKATMEIAGNLKRLLNDFSHRAGLAINCDKATTEAILNFKIGSLPIRYLGAPLFSSRLKAADCQPLMDKYRKRLAGWRTSLLSYSGRVELIKSTLSSLHIFRGSCFSLPGACIKALDQQAMNFSGDFMRRTITLKPYLGKGFVSLGAREAST